MIAFSDANAASSTMFTYQGFLKESGVPTDGTFDFQFAIYDADTAGTQRSSTLTSDDVTVISGFF